MSPPAPRGFEPFTLEGLPGVDPSKLEPSERARIERVVVDREELLVDLQSQLVGLRSERDALGRRVEQLETEREELRERLETVETRRPSLGATELFGGFTTAVGTAREELEDLGTEYTVADVEVDLKTSVVATDDGVQFHLPSIGDQLSSGGLSGVRFRLREQTPTRTEELREVPDVRYLDREAAIGRLERAGFAVGDVDTERTDEDPPGTVVGQFPSPYSVVPPEVDPVVDIVVAEATADVGEARTEWETDANGEARDVREVPGIGRVRAGHLEEAGITRLDQFAASDPEEVADLLEVTPHRAERWIEYARTLLSRG